MQPTYSDIWLRVQYTDNHTNQTQFGRIKRIHQSKPIVYVVFNADNKLDTERERSKYTAESVSINDITFLIREYTTPDKLTRLNKHIYAYDYDYWRYLLRKQYFEWEWLWREIIDRITWHAEWHIRTLKHAKRRMETESFYATRRKS